MSFNFLSGVVNKVEGAAKDVGGAAKAVGHGVIAADKVITKPFSFLGNLPVGQGTPTLPVGQQIHALGHAAQDVGQQAISFGGAVGSEIANKVTGPLGVGIYNKTIAPVFNLPHQTFTPNTFNTSSLGLGDNQVLSPTQTYSALRQGGHGAPLSFLAGALTAAGAYPGGSAESDLAKSLVKATTAEDATKTLVKSGVDEVTAKSIAPAVAATKDPNIIQNIITKAHTPPVLTPSGINDTIGGGRGTAPSQISALNANHQLLIDSQKLSTAQRDVLNSTLKANGRNEIEKGSTPISVSIDELKTAATVNPSILQNFEIRRALSVAKQETSNLPISNHSGLGVDTSGQLHSVENTTMNSTNASGNSGDILNPGLKGAVENVGNKSDIANLPTATDITAGTKAKDVGTAVRSSYIGELDAQRLSGTHLNEALKKAAPDEQGAIFWYREARGDTAKLQEALTNPKFAPYHEDIQKALNLSPEAKDASRALDVAYQKTGEAAAGAGTIKGALQDYGNSRFYLQEPNTGGLASTLRQGTGASQSRQFPDAFAAVDADKQFATTNAADAFALHNSELARVNTTRKLFDTMQENGLGKWTTGAPPEGWARVEGVSKSGAFTDASGIAHSTQYSFTAPKEIADRMAALTKVDALKRSGLIRNSQAYQGLVKTLDLSFSLFHHLTMTIQALSQTKLGYDVIKNWNKIGHMDSTEFRKLELQAVKDGNIRTTKVAGNQDIARSLFSSNNKTWTDVVKDAPVAKQVLAGAHASTSILFDKMQRYLKVMDWHGKMEKWIAANPQATAEEYSQAARDYGKEINAAYGGLNWEALGITKTQQSVLRAVLLAPDWVISNASLIKYLGVKGAAGSAARQHMFTALVSGMVATEAINKAVTGHFTDQNQKGHWSEIELAPGVHISLIRGGPGELLKIMSNIYDKGPATGIGSYVQGKESPFARTLTGILTGKDYQGQSITGGATSFPGKALGEAKFIGANLGPVPFGAQGGVSYVKNAIQEHTPINPVALGASATGLARYTTPNPGITKPQRDILTELRQENAPQEQIDSYKAFFSVKIPSSTPVNKEIDKALLANNYDQAFKLAQDYNAKVQKDYTKWSNKYGNNVPDDLYSRYTGKFINPDSFDSRLDKLSTPLLQR